jgi:hypothetical protein
VDRGFIHLGGGGEELRIGVHVVPLLIRKAKEHRNWETEAIPIASLRWHYPDQVQGYFSPGGSVIVSQPGPLALCRLKATSAELYARTGLSKD